VQIELTTKKTRADPDKKYFRCICESSRLPQKLPVRDQNGHLVEQIKDLVESFATFPVISLLL